MKANELRIGNWVRYHHNGGFIDAQIFHLTDEDINVLPIPLSPEIIEKCGFEDEYGNGRYYFDGLEYYDGKLWFRTSEIKIQYLHQFQNLYFALTGEELEVNLTFV
jgi:hypothetical protein